MDGISQSALDAALKSARAACKTILRELEIARSIESATGAPARARALSVTITHVETAELWLKKASDVG